MTLATYTKSCSKNVGGNSRIFLAEAANITSVTVTSGEVSAITAPVAFKEIQAETDSIFRNEESIALPQSTHYQISVGFKLNRPSLAVKILRDSLADASPCGICALVKDGNGTWWLVGYNETDLLTRCLFLQQDNMNSGAEVYGDDIAQADIILSNRLQEKSLRLTDALGDKIDAGTALFIDQAVYSAEYQAVYDSWTTKPSAAVAEQQDLMVREWVASGWWAKRDVVYVFAIHTNDNDEALVNWKNPGTNDATLVGTAPAFTPFVGFTGAGTGYINTNFSFANDSSNYLSNDASVGFYRSEDAYGNADLAAGARNVAGGFRTSHILDQTQDQANIYINGVSKTITGSGNNGRFSGSLLSGQIDVYQNGKWNSDNTGLTPKALYDLDCFILCYNVDGAASNYYLSDCGEFDLGGASTHEEEVRASVALEAYMASNSKGTVTKDNYNIQCDGNSLTQGTGTEVPYTTKLATLDADYEIANHGGGGRTGDDMISAALVNVDQAYDPHKIENICVAWEITNSIFSDGDTPQEAVTTILNYCKSRRDLGYKVIVLSSLPRSSDAGLNADLLEANVLLEAQYREYADFYIDLRTNSKLADQDDTTYFLVDKIHLTTAGYEEVAAMVHTVIQDIIS